MFKRTLLCLGLSVAAAIVGPDPALASVHGSAYTESGRCGPFARAAVTTLPGTCVGIVAGKAQGLIMPRAILETAPGQFIVTDMGGWNTKKGRVLRLTVSADGVPAVSPLLTGLVTPHGLAKGPDGKVYIGLPDKIIRIDPASPAPQAETVLDGLPNDGLHPLKTIIFDAKGRLIINVGARTDRCGAKGKPKAVQSPCPEDSPGRPAAALWSADFDGPGGKVTKVEVLARGLRNSMALAVHPQSDLIVQGENSLDLEGEEEPEEELNIIIKGKHYGWPYCAGRVTLAKAPAGQQVFCGTEGGTVLMPAHAAPLGMLYYTGAMFPVLNGKLVVGFHGYRANGHRIVAYDTKPDGTPVAPPARGAYPGFPLELVKGWDMKPGIRPRGAPVGLAQASDGSIWFAEDKNKTIMVLLAGGQAGAAGPQPVTPARAAPQPKGFAEFQSKVLKSRCGTCHAELRASDPAKAWAYIVKQGWAGSGPVKDSALVRSMEGKGPERPMPPPSGLKHAPSLAALEAFLKANAGP